MISGRKILLTGGAGFIGSYIAEKLKDDNELIILDNLSRNSLKYVNLEKNDSVKIYNGSILNVNDIKKAAKGITDVVHMAAIVGPSLVADAPLTTMKINLIGTYNLLEIVKDLKLNRFIIFSTSEVYGPNAKNVSESNFSSHGPINELRWTYSVSKVASEHLAHCYHKSFGLPFVSIRPFNIFGPRQFGNGAVRIFTEAALRRQPIRLIGDGNGVRSYCYISDFMDCLLPIFEKDNVIGEVFNIGNPKEPISSYDLAKKIIEKTNSSSKIEFDKARKEDILVRIPDIAKARKMLGFEPKISLDEGIEKTATWMKDVYLKDAA